jgi:hypothetical protein
VALARSKIQGLCKVVEAVPEIPICLVFGGEAAKNQTNIPRGRPDTLWVSPRTPASGDIASALLEDRHRQESVEYLRKSW